MSVCGRRNRLPTVKTEERDFFAHRVPCRRCWDGHEGEPLPGMGQQEKYSQSGQDQSVDRPVRPVNAREESDGAADQERSPGDQQCRRKRIKWHGGEEKDEQSGEKHGGNRYAKPEISDGPPSIQHMFVHDVPQSVLYLAYRARSETWGAAVQCEVEAWAHRARKPVDQRAPGACTHIPRRFWPGL